MFNRCAIVFTIQISTPFSGPSFELFYVNDGSISIRTFITDDDSVGILDEQISNGILVLIIWIIKIASDGFKALIFQLE